MQTVAARQAAQPLTRLKKALVPIDFSLPSQEALEYAPGFASWFDASGKQPGVAGGMAWRRIISPPKQFLHRTHDRTRGAHRSLPGFRDPQETT